VLICVIRGVFFAQRILRCPDVGDGQTLETLFAVGQSYIDNPVQIEVAQDKVLRGIERHVAEIYDTAVVPMDHDDRNILSEALDKYEFLPSIGVQIHCGGGESTSRNQPRAGASRTDGGDGRPCKAGRIVLGGSMLRDNE